MLPTPYQGGNLPSIYGSSPNYSSLGYDIAGGFINAQSFPSQSLLPGLHAGPFQGSDPNSPEAFKQNIQLVLGHVARVQNLARNVLSGIEHAYYPGINPVQTAADMTTLQHALQVLAEILRQTGVGALPVQAPDLANPPAEEEMMADTIKSIQILYERYKRIQESAGVVASLLNATEPAARK